MSKLLNTQWCENHWSNVRDTFDSDAPINGLLMSVQIVNYWIYLKEKELGDQMPASSNATAINALMELDAPLCCRIGQLMFDAIKDTCALPEEYKRLPVAEGHRQHLIDFGYE